MVESSGTIDDLQYKLIEKKISDKIISIKLYLKLDQIKSIQINSWNISLDNGIESHGQNQVSVKLVKDAHFSPWTQWSSCSKSCIGLDEKYGN
jgi:hypothetical protein